MSDTEREAIEAGTVWWEKDLLTGNPEWDRLLRMGTQSYTAEEQAFIDGSGQRTLRHAGRLEDHLRGKRYSERRSGTT